ncbi:MAG: hypothetical protein ACJ8F7_10230 [Gemmataceae bacterium]
MKSSQIIPKDEQNHFWNVVRQCIRSFHARCASTTLPKAGRLRKKVDGMPPEQMEMFYHAEPFDVACDLAGNRLDVGKHLTEYLRLRDPDDSRD